MSRSNIEQLRIHSDPETGALIVRNERQEVVQNVEAITVRSIPTHVLDGEGTTRCYPEAEITLRSPVDINFTLEPGEAILREQFDVERASRRVAREIFAERARIQKALHGYDVGVPSNAADQARVLELARRLVSALLRDAGDRS